MGLRDPVSSASHLFFAIWAGFALLLMMRRTKSGVAHQVAVAIFGSSMILLYLSSSLFHGLPFTSNQDPQEFRFFQLLDQSAIFVLIAGTNTPLMATFLHGRRRVLYLLGIWSMAGLAIASLWLLPKAQHGFIVVVYLAMGWLGMMPMRHYYRAVGWRAMNWLLLGCLLYSAAASCELTNWPVILMSPVRFGPHEMFHLVSGLASFAFFMFVLRHVIPYESDLRKLTNALSRLTFETRRPVVQKPRMFGPPRSFRV
jgi:hemolysin III